MRTCKSVNCWTTPEHDHDFCAKCIEVANESTTRRVSSKYPKFFKNVELFDEIDVFAVHKLFNIQDPSGCIQNASRKLLLSGAGTGGKSTYQDIKEARDTLSRWLELNLP